VSPQNIFAIGDIHGCAQQLDTLLGRIPYDRKRDTLIFLGDYINRGPDSKAVLDTLLELKEYCADIYFLKGNHEQELLEYSVSGHVESLRALRAMGVEATVESYSANVRSLPGLGCFPPAHRDFLYNLRFSLLKDDYLFIHADINEDLLRNPNKNPGGMIQSSITESNLLSSRRLAKDQTTLIGSMVVFGHIPFASPLVLHDRIGIDTGAVFGNMLTAVQLPQLRFFHA